MGFMRCVELGCGVGRVTVPLAKRFVQAIGLDISSAHLRVAQEHARAIGIQTSRSLISHQFTIW